MEENTLNQTSPTLNTPQSNSGSSLKLLLAFFLIVILLIAVCAAGYMLGISRGRQEIPPPVKNVALQCAKIDIPNYEVFREFYVDLRGNGIKNLIRIYEDQPADSSGYYNTHSQPIQLKIFSNYQECPKEEFSYISQISENEVSETGTGIQLNFWGDNKNVLMISGIQTGYGSGFTTDLHFLFYRDNGYTMVDGPSFGSTDGYLLAGESAGIGTKIIVAQAKWEAEEGHYGDHRYHFLIYTFDPNSLNYTKVEGGTTKNKYSSPPSSISDILKAEPAVLNLNSQKTQPTP